MRFPRKCTTHRWKVTHQTSNGKLLALRCKDCPAVATAPVSLYEHDTLYLRGEVDDGRIPAAL